MDWKGRKEVFKKKLKQRDYSELLRLIKRRLYINFVLRPVGLPFAAVLIPFLYMMEPFKKIRIAVIPSDRIGHLALNTELFLRRRQLDRSDLPNVTNIFLLKEGMAANRQLVTMFRRNLFILESRALFLLYVAIDWVLCRTRFTFDLPMKDNENYEFRHTDTSLILTDDEEKRGERHLKEMGVDLLKDWFVCIHSRDRAYLAQQNPRATWSYHDYRDSDINDFTKAIRYIIDQGGYVIRMGSVVEKPLIFRHDKLIDYAVTCRSDFMDIYLIAKCKFLLGTTAGICDVATVMDKPRLSVNHAPPGVMPTGKNNLYIPKKVKSKKNDRYLSLSEVLRRGWDWVGIDYNELGYEYEDNTPDEILEATKEMLSRLSGTFELSKEDEKLLQEYFNIFKPNNLAYNVKTPIGMQFLKNNPKIVFGS